MFICVFLASSLICYLKMAILGFATCITIVNPHSLEWWNVDRLHILQQNQQKQFTWMKPFRVAQASLRGSKRTLPCVPALLPFLFIFHALPIHMPLHKSVFPSMQDLCVRGKYLHSLTLSVLWPECSKLPLLASFFGHKRGWLLMSFSEPLS